MAALGLAIMTGLAAPTPAFAQSMCDGMVAGITGSSGNDILVGTDDSDVINGLGGNDTISGFDGDDVICGGDGADTIYGERELVGFSPSGTSSDRIFGQNGADTIVGDFRDYELIYFGDPSYGGPDYIVGGEGNDTIYGNMISLGRPIPRSVVAPDNTIVGGTGNDTIYGSAQGIFVRAPLSGSNDTLTGGPGHDIIYGDYQSAENLSYSIAESSFRDTINGGPGNDLLYGDCLANCSALSVGAGSAVDTIDGGTHLSNPPGDTADGGLGADTCTNVETAINC